VLWPEGGVGGWPLPRDTAEWLGVLGGFTFALNNVLLRRESHRPAEARALAMFLGGAAVSVALALALGPSAGVPWPPAPGAWLVAAALMGLVFLGSNLALQQGAAHLPASVTAVVMVSEVLFASVSAVLLGAGTLSTRLVVGGALIVGAALLAAREGG
jgi:drug/metabolite transporter (DMT)-like permease